MEQEKIEMLIDHLVSDINARALQRSQNREYWTRDDCRKGTKLGREIAKVIGGQFIWNDTAAKK